MDRPPPKAYANVTVRLTPDEIITLDEAARKMSLSRAVLLRRVILAHLGLPSDEERGKDGEGGEG